MLEPKFIDLGYAITDDGKLSKVSKSGRVSFQAIQSLQNEMGDNWKRFCLDYIATFPIPVRLAFGDDIHRVFENHRPGSCMRSKDKRDMREVYANNPDDVCAAYAIKDEHELLCSSFSAIIWTGKKTNYIDRIYSSGAAFAGAVDSFASAIAETIFAHNGKTVKTIFGKYAGIEHAEKVTFTLQHNSSEPLPWLDSMKVIVGYTDSTVKLSTSGDGEVCQNQDGTCPDGTNTSRYMCCNCSERVDEDDIRTTDNGDCYCDYCYNECFTYCDWSGECYPNDDVSYVTVYANGRVREMTIADDVLRSDFTECSGDSCEYIHDDDGIELSNGDYISPADMEEGSYCELDDGSIVELDDAVFCVDIDAYMLVEDAYQWADGDYRSQEEDETDKLAEEGIDAVPIMFLSNSKKSVEVLTCIRGFCVHKRPDTSYFDISHRKSGLSAGIVSDNLESAIRKLSVFVDNMSDIARQYFDIADDIPDTSNYPDGVLDGTLTARRLAVSG